MTQKRKLWQWLTVFFAVMLLCAAALRVNAATDSGRCGAKLYWSFDETTGSLAFTGTGAMFAYADQSPPWLAYADQIRTITFEKGITTIADRAFYGCAALQSALIPGTVTSLGAAAFEGCSALTALPLSAGACVIGENAFRGCTALVDITIPEGVTLLGASAFEGCAAARSLSLPQSLSQLGAGAFRGCAALREFSVAAGNPSYRAAGNCLLSTDGILLLGSESSTIPQDGSVHTVAADAFRDRIGLNAVTVPDSVTTIEDYAFLGCTGLTQVSLGAGLEKLGVGAFQGCAALKQLHLPDSLREIGACAFSGCGSLRSVNFPEELESLGSWSFAGTAITEVHLSDAVDLVGINPFRGCYALTSISVNYRNRSYKALGNCLISSSDKVLVSGCRTSQPALTAVTTIGRDAFRDIELSSLDIPDSVQTVEQYAFAGSALSEIRFGAGVQLIRGNPLAGCTGLRAISVSEENPVYRAEGNCLLRGTTLVVGCDASQVPGTVTVIGPEAFSGTSVTDILLPEGVTHIQKRAFFGCRSLTAVDLPDSLVSIDESAFELSALAQLSLGQLPEIGHYAFFGCYDLKTIYTADGAILEPGSTDHGYIAYYAEQVRQGRLPRVLHYIGDSLQGSYISLPKALTFCTEGWLQLSGPAQVNMTLTRDLYIDLAGFDLKGTIDTAGFRVYGMDSTTADYTCENTGIFSCVTPTGAAVVPQRHFTSDRAGQSLRYMAVAEENGYSFHRFFVDLVYSTVNTDRIGVGYKAQFHGDEKVHAQLDPRAAFQYELCLQGYRPVLRTIPAERIVSGEPIRLLVYNYRVQEHGETPLSTRVRLRLADGTVIQSDAYTVTLRSLTEYINQNTQMLDAEQLKGLLAMMEAFPVMKTWEVDNILGMKQ